jgi:hypothetical protein
MENDLQILNEEYLSNHLLENIQILNFSLNDQTKKILKMKTVSNGK